MKRFFLYIFLSSLFVGQLSAQKFVVVIDAGHGGKDPGAVSGLYKEKNINLPIALQLGKYIEDKYSDTKVIYTRTTDEFIDLDKRANIANKAKANLFISIHTNSTKNNTEKAFGAETYIQGASSSSENLDVAIRENSVIEMEDNYKKKYSGFDPKSPESYIMSEFVKNLFVEQSYSFADLIQSGMKNVAKRKDRGVRHADFLVLRRTKMPSVLVEVGFISNTNDVVYLSSQAGQRAIASAIFDAFGKHKKEIQKKQASTAVNKENSNNSSQKKLSETLSTEIVTKTVVKENDRATTVSEKQINQPIEEVSKEESSTENPTKEPQKNKADNGNKKITNSINKFIVQKTKNNSNESTIDVDIKRALNPISTDNKNEEVVKDEPTSRKAENINVAPKKKTEQKAKPQTESNEIEYRVQFLIKFAQLPKNSPLFKWLNNVGFYKDDGGYKYTYGSTKNYEKALEIQKQVKANFPDAFIVKFRNNNRIK